MRWTWQKSVRKVSHIRAKKHSVKTHPLSVANNSNIFVLCTNTITLRMMYYIFLYLYIKYI